MSAAADLGGEMNKLNRWGASALIALCVSGVAAAANDNLDAVRNAAQRALGRQATVKSVATTPIAGLYEINLGSEVIYSDASGRYMLVGELQDTKTGDNLTAQRHDQLNRIRFADLPLDQAVVTRRGNGQRKLAVFSDPNCGYCKRLEQALQKIDNVTVYTFLVPILSADSRAKVGQIWCSADSSKTYLDWMLHAQTPVGKGPCTTPAERNVALAQKFGISGTPVIFFADGSRIPGAVNEQQIENRLAALR